MWPFKPKKKGILLTGRIRNAFGDVIHVPLKATILEETDVKYKIRITGYWYWVSGTWIDKNIVELIGEIWR
jgi:hypothetical protein